MVLAGLITAAAMSIPRVKRLGFTNRQIFQFFVIGLTVDLVGSQLIWLVRARPDLSRGWWELFNFYRSGASSLTVLGPGVLVIGWILKSQGRPVLPVMAAIAPPLVLAMAIVRIGCFVQGCCYGLFTKLPWGICSPGETQARHPTQLYEMVFLIGLFFWLLRLEKKLAGPTRRVVTAVAGYAAFRFLNDFFRIDHLFPLALGLTTTQWIALAALLICGVIFLKKRSACIPSCFK
jgi:phosphatidylglycerol:prolipoprotein diacylglycerol transferase